MPYLGNEPAVAHTSTTKDSFSGDGSTTDFTMSKSANVNAVRVVVENVVQNPTVAYTCSGTTISFTSAPPTGTNNIYVVHLGPPAATVAPPTTINNSTTFGDGADIITGSKGTDNVRLGENAGNSIASGGNNNVTIGKDAGTAITTGVRNTLVGGIAGDALTTGGDNTVFGYNALTSDTLGSRSVAIGRSVLSSQNFTSATDAYNTAVGYGAGGQVTTGQFNTLVGGLAGDAITTGADNVAVGYLALSTNIVGGNNTAVGSLALEDNTGGNNTGVGYKAMNVNIGGSNNTALGSFALASNTTGSANVSIGNDCMDSNTTGSNHVAIGVDALQAETAGNNCVAIGYEALTAQNNSGGGNIYNNALGYGAGKAITTGGYNTLMGGFAGDAIQSGGSNVCLGYGADVAHDTSNGIIIGVNIEGASNDFSFGKTSNVVTNDFNADANWSRSSDERLKKNITDQKLGLDFINDLRTVKYNWKANGELDASDSQLAHLRREDDDGNIINDMDTDVTMHNFIAQEVKAALDKEGVSDFGGWKEDQYGVQQLSREMFVIPLVKAVQELSAKVTALETENTAIKARLDALEAG